MVGIIPRQTHPTSSQGRLPFCSSFRCLSRISFIANSFWHLYSATVWTGRMVCLRNMQITYISFRPLRPVTIAVSLCWQMIAKTSTEINSCLKLNLNEADRIKWQVSEIPGPLDLLVKVIDCFFTNVFHNLVVLLYCVSTLSCYWVASGI